MMMIWLVAFEGDSDESGGHFLDERGYRSCELDEENRGGVVLPLEDEIDVAFPVAEERSDDFGAESSRSMRRSADVARGGAGEGGDEHRFDTGDGNRREFPPLRRFRGRIRVFALGDFLLLLILEVVLDSLELVGVHGVFFAGGDLRRRPVEVSSASGRGQELRRASPSSSHGGGLHVH